MRTYALIVAAAAGILFPLASANAISSNCEELRLACEHKDSLGEQGGGDCQRYRASCQRHTSCGRLRYLCLHKDEYGAQGQGYCQTYRETCR